MPVFQYGYVDIDNNCFVRTSADPESKVETEEGDSGYIGKSNNSGWFNVTGEVLWGDFPNYGWNVTCQSTNDVAVFSCAVRHHAYDIWVEEDKDAKEEDMIVREYVDTGLGYAPGFENTYLVLENEGTTNPQSYTNNSDSVQVLFCVKMSPGDLPGQQYWSPCTSLNDQKNGVKPKYCNAYQSDKMVILDPGETLNFWGTESPCISFWNVFKGQVKTLKEYPKKIYGRLIDGTLCECIAWVDSIQDNPCFPQKVPVLWKVIEPVKVRLPNYKPNDTGNVFLHKSEPGLEAGEIKVDPNYIFVDPFFPHNMTTPLGWTGRQGCCGKYPDTYPTRYAWIIPPSPKMEITLNGSGGAVFKYTYMPQYYKIEREGIIQPADPTNPQDEPGPVSYPMGECNAQIKSSTVHFEVPLNAYRLLCSRQITAVNFFAVVDFCLKYDNYLQAAEQEKPLSESEKKMWVLQWMQDNGIGKHLFDDIYSDIKQIPLKAHDEQSGESCPVGYEGTVADYLISTFCKDQSTGDLVNGTKKIMWFRKIPQHDPYSVIFYKGKKIATIDFACTAVYDMGESVAIIGLEHAGTDPLMSDSGYFDACMVENRTEKSESTWTGNSFSGAGVNGIGWGSRKTSIQGGVVNYHYTQATLAPYLPNPFAPEGKGEDPSIDSMTVGSAFATTPDERKPNTENLQTWSKYVAKYPSYVLYLFNKDGNTGNDNTILVKTGTDARTAGTENKNITREEGERPTDISNPSLPYMFRINDIESPVAFDAATDWREPWETGGVQSGIPITGAVFPFHGRIADFLPIDQKYWMFYGEADGLIASQSASQFNFIRSKPLFSKVDTAVCGTNSSLLWFNGKGEFAQYDIENFKRVDPPK